MAGSIWCDIATSHNVIKIESYLNGIRHVLHVDKRNPVTHAIFTMWHVPYRLYSIFILYPVAGCIDGVMTYVLLVTNCRMGPSAQYYILTTGRDSSNLTRTVSDRPPGPANLKQYPVQSLLAGSLGRMSRSRYDFQAT